MRVICPKCRDELEVPEEQLGRKIGCASCHVVFTATLGEPDPDSVDSETYEDSGALPKRRRRNSEPPVRKSNVGVWGVVFLMFLVLAPCVGGGTWSFLRMLYPKFHPVTDKDGRFEAMFPGPTFPLTQSNEEGRLVRGVQCDRGFPPEKYFIAYADLPQNDPKDGPAVLKLTADLFTLQVPPDAKEVAREETKFDDYDALDVRYQALPGEFVARYVFVPGANLGRVYMIGWGGAGRPQDARVRQFFTSVKIQK